MILPFLCLVHRHSRRYFPLMFWCAVRPLAPRSHYIPLMQTKRYYLCVNINNNNNNNINRFIATKFVYKNMSALEKSMFKPDLPRSSRQPAFDRPSSKCRARDYDPVDWTGYFTESLDVSIGENTFHVYCTGEQGPTIVLLHGGGYGALTWAEFTKCITSMIVTRVLAIDLRGHGDTHTTNDQDLSVNTLASDVAAVVSKLTQDNSIVLVGHSMGGAVAVRAAPQITHLVGLCVIDVVEGTAMESLTSMQSFLRSRPTTFESIPQAIEWCVRSGQIRNVQSAKVSVPGQIKNIKTGKLATNDIKSSSVATTAASLPTSLPMENNVIPEETEIDLIKPSVPKRNYMWRIDLAKTEQHWSGWFRGLSATFLETSVPKLLLLAGIDRLDRELTVGQMQGKFQMQVLPACGHAVHEDVPDKVAEAIATFMVRHKFAQAASNFERVFPAC